MSLKTRLRVSIVVLVVGLVLALSALTLHSVATAKFEDLWERANATTLQVQTMLVQHLNQESAALPPAQTIQEAKEQWTRIVEGDTELPHLLEEMLASSRTILEIQLTGDSGRILTSSNPASVGKQAQQLVSLADWARESPWLQLRDVFVGEENFEIVMPVGAGDQVFFQIRVILSSILLRNTLQPVVQRMVLGLSFSFLAAVFLAFLVSNIASHPLVRVGEALDRIARGESPLARGGEKNQPEEVAALESKLQVLGQQFRGAREDAVHLRGNIEQLLERLEEGVLLFDRNNRLIMAGRAVEALLGRGRWELLGHTIEELFPPSGELGAAVSGAIGLQQPLKDSLIAVEREEGQPPVRLLLNVEFLESFPGRERLGSLVSLRDAESRREIGTHLDLSARLAAISRLTGGVAHEIKNPLNSIALHLEVLRARLEGEGREVAQEIDVIANEITRLDRVVKTFLDFARPLDLNLVDTDAGTLMREIATLVAPEAAGLGVEVSLECGPAPVLLRADRDLLKQALLNVVMNAVEAMKDGGRLELSARQTGRECVIRISDQGAGIPPEVRDKIFNLYFTTKGSGSGIGLAMTFRVVQLHNGTIDFTSEVGKGTTFWLRLPALETDEAKLQETGI